MKSINQISFYVTLIVFGVCIAADNEPEPLFTSDSEGNAIIEIPRHFWEGKNYQSLKIHLSKKVLQNLTYGWEENCKYQKKFSRGHFFSHNFILDEDRESHRGSKRYKKTFF